MVEGDYMNNNKLGNYIKRKRMERGLSQRDIARILNIKEAVVIKWEKGESIPADSYVTSLAEVFNTTVDNIVSKVNE